MYSQTCAWVLLKDKTTSFQFIDCMEESNDFPQASAEKVGTQRLR